MSQSRLIEHETSSEFASLGADLTDPTVRVLAEGVKTGEDPLKIALFAENQLLHDQLKAAGNENQRLRDELNAFEARNKELVQANADLRTAHQAEVDRLQAQIADEAQTREAIVEASKLDVHDVRNPLTTISGCAELIERNSTESRVKTFAQMIFRQSKRANELIGTSLHRLETWQPSKPEVFEAHALMQDVALENEAMVNSKQGQLIAVFSPNCEKVYADPKRIKQAFNTIILNAVQYINEGGSVTITEVTNGKEIIYLIEDNGCGMSKEAQSQWMIEYKKFRTKGTGIGLPAALRVVKDAGGELWLYKTGPGQGTTFAVSLPIHKQ